MSDAMPPNTHSNAAPKSSWGRFVPIGIFLLAVLVFAIALLGQKPENQSPLVGQAAPTLPLQIYGESGQFDLSAYKGKVVILNAFASWCVPCRGEHSKIMKLAENKNIVVLGLAYRDSEAGLKSYLSELGNPYAQIAQDNEGKLGVLLGLRGVPETWLIDKNGIVRGAKSGALMGNDGALLAQDAARLAAQ